MDFLRKQEQSTANKKENGTSAYAEVTGNDEGCFLTKTYVMPAKAGIPFVLFLSVI